MLHINFTKLAGIGLLSAFVLTGCDRRTPEERLGNAVEFYQQQDPLSAETEAMKIIDKTPDDPAAVQAHLLLATIYAGDNRLDESLSHIEQVLDKVPQTDQLGKDALRMYLEVLQKAGNFKEAIATTEKYQQKYADDPGTSLSLIVGRADIMTNAGETTAAREVLQSVIKETTGTAELDLYREMMAKTYMRDNNISAAITYFESELAAMDAEAGKIRLAAALAQLHAINNDYENVRKYLSILTQDVEKSIREELDSERRLSYVLGLAGQYDSLGNLKGSRRTYKAVYDSGVSNPQIASMVIQAMTGNLLSQRETSAAMEFLNDANTKYPALQLENAIKEINNLIAANKLDAVAPYNTAPLTLRFNADEPLYIRNLEAILEIPGAVDETASTATAATETTGTVNTQTEAPVTTETVNAAEETTSTN